MLFFPLELRAGFFQQGLVEGGVWGSLHYTFSFLWFGFLSPCCPNLFLFVSGTHSIGEALFGIICLYFFALSIKAGERANLLSKLWVSILKPAAFNILFFFAEKMPTRVGQLYEMKILSPESLFI